jgi:hypothetical protein
VGSRKGERVAIDRVVLPHWLEMGIAVAIVLVGLLGWKLIIVDVWLAETDAAGGGGHPRRPRGTRAVGRERSYRYVPVILAQRTSTRGPTDLGLPWVQVEAVRLLLFRGLDHCRVSEPPWFTAQVEGQSFGPQLVSDVLEEIEIKTPAPHWPEAYIVAESLRRHGHTQGDSGQRDAQ